MKAYLTSFWLLCFVLVLTVTGIVILEDLKRKWAKIGPDAGIIDDDNFYQALGKGWHQMDLGAFSISTPERFLFRQRQGIDSYVGEITDGESTISFDYGRYSSNLTGYTETYERAKDTICGIPVYLSRPIYPGGGVSGAHFPKVIGDSKLTLFSNKLMDSELFIKIIHSIRTPDCLDGMSANSEFPKFSIARSAKEVFSIKCAACHKIKGKLVGTGLADISEDKFEAWYFAIVPPSDTTQNWQGPRIHRKLFPVSNIEREALIEYIYTPYLCY